MGHSELCILFLSSLCTTERERKIIFNQLVNQLSMKTFGGYLRVLFLYTRKRLKSEQSSVQPKHNNIHR